MELSNKGRKLIELYSKMASEGYERADGSFVENAYSDFEAKKFKGDIKYIFKKLEIKSTLDYGCGGSNWNAPGFTEDLSAKEFFELENVYHYEPARNIDERQKVDCVLSFDVLEHIYIEDIPAILRDIFSNAEKLVVLNVACYKAAAILPNGENAHITVRNPLWWKGVLDTLSIEYPDIAIFLICSIGYNTAEAFPIWSAKAWEEDEKFEIEY
jgi:hypothetical protein